MNWLPLIGSIIGSAELKRNALAIIAVTVLHRRAAEPWQKDIQQGTAIGSKEFENCDG
jgi:hypothetical protein